MGYFAKGIVVILAIMSIWSLTIMIQKYIQFKRAQAETRKFAPQFSRAIQEENLDQAIALAEKSKKSHVARVVGEALAEVKPLLRDRATITAADINSAERAVERQMLITLSDFKRGIGILATVGSTAPFVGLLGTTMGIVNAAWPRRAPPAASPVSRPVSPKPLSPLPSVCSSPFRRCGRTTTSLPRSKTSPSR
jgi:biopolymer transport protein ExbB/biopolymer transport protein TolQ